MLPFHQAAFSKSAFKTSDLPLDENAEVAFAGRSNVGKSSVINLLTRQKKLAKVSKTPGRTQAINFFKINDHTSLVDLPGYGYAKTSQALQTHWKTFLQSYILERKALRGIFLVMDVRHPFTELDQLFLDLSSSIQLPCHALLNKSDKLSNNEKSRVKQQLIQDVLPHYPLLTWHFFSAAKGEGLNELVNQFEKWVRLEKNNVTSVT